MTFILVDLAEKQNDLQLPNRDWRWVAAEINRRGFVSAPRAETLASHLSTAVYPTEAEVIAGHLTGLLQSGTLPKGIAPDTISKVVNFLTESSGFEIC